MAMLPEAPSYVHVTDEFRDIIEAVHKIELAKFGVVWDSKCDKYRIYGATERAQAENVNRLLEVIKNIELTYPGMEQMILDDPYIHIVDDKSACVEDRHHLYNDDTDRIIMRYTREAMSDKEVN